MPSSSKPKPSVGTSSEPGHTNLKEDAVERELDEALMDTFPASDPLPLSPGSDTKSEDAQVDEALQETFPASDPTSPAQSHKK